MGAYDTPRFIFVTAFMSVGWTAELRDVSWETGWWDPDDKVPKILWNERKVSNQTLMNFFVIMSFMNAIGFTLLGAIGLMAGALTHTWHCTSNRML